MMENIDFWWIFGGIVVLGALLIIWQRNSKSTTTTSTSGGGVKLPSVDWSGLKKFLPVLVAVGVAGFAYYLLQNGGLSGGESAMKIEDWQKNLLIALAIGVVAWLVFTGRLVSILAIAFIVAILYTILSHAGCFNKHQSSHTKEVVERKLYEFSMYGDEVRINVPKGYKPHFYPKGGQTKNCPPKGHCYTDTPGVDIYPKVFENHGVWTISKASKEATGVEVWLERKPN